MAILIFVAGVALLCSAAVAYVAYRDRGRAHRDPLSDRAMDNVERQAAAGQIAADLARVRGGGGDTFRR